MAVGAADAALSLWDLRVLDVPALFSCPLGRVAPFQLAVIRGLVNPHLLREEDAELKQFVKGRAPQMDRLFISPGWLDVEVDWNPPRRRWSVSFEGARGARAAAVYGPLFAWGAVRPAIRPRRRRRRR